MNNAGFKGGGRISFILGREVLLQSGGEWGGNVDEWPYDTLLVYSNSRVNVHKEPTLLSCVQ